MDTTEEVNIQHTTPLLGKAKKCSCSPLVFVYMFALVTMISAMVIIIWWACYSGNGEISIEIITRETWEAKYVSPNATNPLQVNPPTHIIISHTLTPQCFNQIDCSDRVRKLQIRDIDKNACDIAENFLIGSDGRVYEGRGWDIAGVSANNYNNRSLAVTVIGNYEDQEPSGRVLKVTKLFIEESVKRKKLASNYKLLGIQQVVNVLYPGKKLFNIIKTWPHWEDCTIDRC